MAKELPYFQFEPAEWITKDITLCSFEAQGLFVNIMCYYWQRGCNLPLTTLKRRFNHPNLIEELIDDNIIRIENNDVIIDFLDKQHKIISKRNKILSAAGRKGGMTKRSEATLKPPLSQVKATPKHIDKIREDKIREDNKKKFIPPILDDVIKYFKDNGYNKQHAEKFWSGYEVYDWHDSRGNKIKNWKQKAVHVWFKEDNKLDGVVDLNEAAIKKRFRSELESLGNKTYRDVIAIFGGAQRKLVLGWLKDMGIDNYNMAIRKE